MSRVPSWDFRLAYRAQHGRMGTIQRLDRHALHGPQWRKTAPGLPDPLEIMRDQRRPAMQFNPLDPHAETRAELYWDARKAAMYPRASRLRQTDMLAMAARCVTQVDKLKEMMR